MSKPRVIAIHLPQFYPFEENDEWWGKGFTEWRNVAKAQPRFRGHYQPHIPNHLGFYDLRLKECRIEQEKLAKEYGIDGFCYYHYWFNGHLIMEKPVEAKLNDPDETLPFMLCWANENWHRNWDGDSNKTLIEQRYSREDDIEHFKYLLPYFKDDRYIKIDGKPVFAIYRTALIPDPEELVSFWKEMARKEGIELYIMRFESMGSGKEYLTKSMDASVEFQPQNIRGFSDSLGVRIKQKLFRIRNRFNSACKAIIYDYEMFVDHMCSLPVTLDYKSYPSLFPCWDNASRRVGQGFMCFDKSSPSVFGKWFKHVYESFVPYSKEENFVFINAWNEWAEGCHLEPDMRHGLGYLEEIKKVVESHD